MNPWLILATVAILIGGVVAYQKVQADAAAARAARSPGNLIGSGVGNLVAGIVTLATEGGSS